MNIEQATIEAKAEAIQGNVDVVVYHDPYDEADNDTDRYGYMTQEMFDVVGLHQKIIKTIPRSG